MFARKIGYLVELVVDENSQLEIEGVVVAETVAVVVVEIEGVVVVETVSAVVVESAIGGVAAVVVGVLTVLAYTASTIALLQQKRSLYLDLVLDGWHPEP